MSDQYPASPPPSAPPAVSATSTMSTESEGERRRRHGHRTRLYVVSLLLLALVIVLIALVAANTRQVQLSWVVGSGSASLVWIIVGSAVMGWLLGLLTSIIFRARTRAPRP